MQFPHEPRTRRVHGAQIKTQVLAACRDPGASVSAVALAHGLNANLVRSWLRGRGLQRAGLAVDATSQAMPGSARASLAQPLQFVPIHLPAGVAAHTAVAPQPPAGPAQSAGGDVIEVQLRASAAQVTVRWPVLQAAQCTQWLRELAAAALDAHAP